VSPAARPLHQNHMNQSQAIVSTELGSQYLRQISRHWAHKYPVEFTDTHSRIELPMALCTLSASDKALTVDVSVHDAADQEHMEEVVAEHLQRFGFRETLVFDWKRL
jgi:hypothetical protein